MEKNVNSTGMYETTYSGDVFVGKLSTPTKIGLTDQTKVSLLEYLTESDDFHKLVCDITGVERKQVKVSQELEKLKEDYSYVCDRYKKEQQKSNYLLNKWRKEIARRLDAEEQCEIREEENDILSKRFSDLEKSYFCIHKEANDIKNSRKKLLAKYIEENKRLTDKVEKLKGKLDRASKSYGELIKIISDRVTKQV